MAVKSQHGILVVLAAIFIINTCSGQDCPSNRFFGENDPKSKDNDIGSNPSYGYMARDSDYTINCCGVTERWEAYFDNIAGSRTVYFQIWRPGASTFTMVGEYGFTVTSRGEQDQTVPVNQRVTVMSGDYMGWWTSGNDAVSHKDGGGGEADNTFMMTLADLNAGDTSTWVGATEEDNRSYAVRLDVNPSTSPTFVGLSNTASVVNSATVGTTIFTVNVDDVDPDDVPLLTVSMSASTKFSFDSSTGIVSVASTLATSSTQVVTFTVTDQCGKSTTDSVTITVTNEAPVITNVPASNNISEDATTSILLHTITATDSASTTVTCSSSTTDPFSVTLIPGSTNYGIYSDNNPNLDYDVQSTYSISIVCSDGELTDTEIFTVNVIQNSPPTFLNLQGSVAISTTATIGSNAFTVSVSDAESDSLTFSMTCDPTGCPFVIFDSGAIQVSQDLSGQSIVGYDISVTVSDGRNTVGPEILTVTFSDINDAVTLSNLPLPAALSIAENTALGTVVYTVSYQDQDTTQVHTFTMTSSPSTGTNYFSIDSSTGVITTASNTLDYEALGATTFTFTVTVSDPVVSDSAALVIDINNVNEAPAFSQNSYSLTASEGNAGAIGTPTWGVTDQDTSDSYTYTMDCGASTGYFSIDGTSGEVSFQSAYDLDVGSLPTSVTCTVTVTDVGGLTDTATLINTINYVNDNTPVFSPTAYARHIDYYAVVGTVVETVTATDADATSHGVISYSLDQSSLPGAFFAIGNSGQISLSSSLIGSALNYSTTITIVATASDVGGLSDTANVVLIISGTTTTSTTTTTDRYRTFSEDPKNVAWIVACVVVLVICFVLLAWIICSCKGQNGCAQFSRHCCKRCKRRYNPRRRNLERRDLESRGRRDWDDVRLRSIKQFAAPPHNPPPPQVNSIRVPPPPKELQPWRHLRL